MDFLCHRLLLTLGIMRDHGDDELFAELFNRDETYLPNTSLTSQDIAEQRIKIGKLLTYDGDRYTLFHDRFRHFWSENNQIQSDSTYLMKITKMFALLGQV